MKNKTLRKVKLTVFALAGFLALVGMPRAEAKQTRHHNHVLYGYAYPAHYNGNLLNHNPEHGNGRYGGGYR